MHWDRSLWFGRSLLKWLCLWKCIQTHERQLRRRDRETRVWEIVFRIIMAHFKQYQVCNQVRTAKGFIELRPTQSYKSALKQCPLLSASVRETLEDLRAWAEYDINASPKAVSNRCALGARLTALHICGRSLLGRTANTATSCLPHVGWMIGDFRTPTGDKASQLPPLREVCCGHSLHPCSCSHDQDLAATGGQQMSPRSHALFG